MRDYRFTHKRFDTHDQIIKHDTGTLSGHSAKEVKHRAVRRFGLQAWNSWTCTAHGTFQRTHTPTPERPYRGVLTLEPIKME